MISIINNLTSIILGLMAWTLPLIYLTAGRRRGLFCCGSFGLCALSLLFQIRELTYRTNIGDLSAVMDTVNAVNFAATVLLVVTLALNVLALVRKER